MKGAGPERAAYHQSLVTRYGSIQDLLTAVVAVGNVVSVSRRRPSFSDVAMSMS